MRNVLLGLSALGLFCCTKPQEDPKIAVAPINSNTTNDPAKGAAMAPTLTAISMVHNGELFMGKPPLKIFYVDTTLTNNQEAPRWFLFPDSLPEEVSRPDGGVDTLEIFQPKGTGKATAIRLLGTHPIGWAVLLPAKSSVTIKNLGLNVWESEIPASLTLKAIVVTDVTLEGKPLASLLTADPTCDAKAEVSFGKSRVDSMLESVHFHEDRKEVPLQYKTEQDLTLTVPIIKK